MNDLAKRLSDTLEKYLQLLSSVDVITVSYKPNPSKWSKKEILGHLIDSASNNHQRFVRIRNQEDLIFNGYDQDLWVEVQGYQNQNWLEIIDLWYQYNKHMVKIIDLIPDNVLHKEHKNHNLDMIAFRTIPADETATLTYFIGDYIDHIDHHMNQIFK